MTAPQSSPMSGYGGYGGIIPTPNAFVVTPQTGTTAGSYSTELLDAYGREFSSLDDDGDGEVSGQVCFPVFVSSGLDRSVLKEIWDLVAGRAGALNRQQFIQCKQLINLKLEGKPLPASPFAPSFPDTPSSAMNRSPQSLHQGASNILPTENLVNSGLMAGMPAIGVRPDPAKDFSYNPNLPGIVTDSANKIYMAGLRGDEKARFDRAMRDAEEHDKSFQEASHEQSVYATKEEWLNAALQQLMLFKGRLQSQSLDLQQSAAEAKRRAEEAEQRLGREERTAQVLFYVTNHVRILTYSLKLFVSLSHDLLFLHRRTHSNMSNLFLRAWTMPRIA